MDFAEISNLQPTSKDCKNLIPALVSLFKTFEDKMKTHFNDLREEFRSSLGERDVKIGHLEDQVKVLQDKVKKMEQATDDADAYERRDTVIFAGPAVPTHSPQEDCSSIVKEIVRRELKIELSNSDFNAVHRLGPKPTAQGPDRRGIIAKFCRRDLKRDVIKASKTQERPARLFVNESLTPARRTIFNTLRQIKKDHPELVCGASTFEGRVYAYTKNMAPNHGGTSRNPRHLVNNYEMLVKFCHEYVHAPITTFLSSWPH